MSLVEIRLQLGTHLLGFGQLRCPGFFLLIELLGRRPKLALDQRLFRKRKFELPGILGAQLREDVFASRFFGRGYSLFEITVCGKGGIRQGFLKSSFELDLKRLQIRRHSLKLRRKKRECFWQSF
jgi:hypothetical protein